MQRLRRSARLILQLEVRVERREVQRNVRAQMLQNPVREPARFAGVVVQRRNHQVGDLEPDIGLVLEPLQRVEHGLEMGKRDLPVEVFAEGFQVDVGCVHVVIDIMESLAGDVAITDHYGAQAVFAGSATDIHHVFAPDRRFVIGKRDRGAAVAQGELGHIFGRDMRGMDLIAAGFGDVPILAKEAAHVAAGRAHGQDYD